eukprot:TRINITY_DN9575_c0_g1_i2.p1 TRINITY_DN9575_c0_g1~~TRINITY_DN9575_c0_g1_i2.p1  ORF type:complete len:286 (+),score=45.62 TRINITY_DN9575_c0_g1_i2:65-859(+)
MLETISELLQDLSGPVLFQLLLIYCIAFLIGYIIKLRQKVNISSEEQNNSGGGGIPTKEQALNLIKTRRSIMPKDLNGELLSNEDIGYLLEAANWAPTHQKTEPWRYTVISGPQNILDYLDFLADWYLANRENVTEAEMSKFDKKYESLRTQLPTSVSHMLVICMKRQALPDKLLPEWEEICATACSVQNIHLALTALPGCGGYWSSHTWCKHARDSKQFKEYLGLEPEDRVFGAFILGKVTPGKTFKSTRGKWQDKVSWRTEE